MAVKWVKEVSNLNRTYNMVGDVGSDFTEYPGETFYFTESLFSGTASFYSEAVAKTNSMTTGSYYVKPVQSSSVSFTSSDTSYTRKRVSDTYLSTGQRDIVIEALYADGSIDVRSARLIIVQSEPSILSTETQIEIGSYEAGLYNGSSGTPNAFTYPKYFYYDADNWDGYCTWYAEVVWVEADNKYDFSCVLQQSSDCGDTDPWTTVHVIVNAAATETRLRSRVTLDAVDMDDGYYYRIAHWNTGDKDTRGYTIYCAKIICLQSAVTLCQSSGSTNTYYDMYDGSSEATAVGQSFEGTGDKIGQIRAHVLKTGSPTGNLYCRLYAHSGTYGSTGVPTGSPLASDSIDVTTLSIGGNYVYFYYDYDTVNGTKYFFVLEYDEGGDSSNYISAESDATGPEEPGNLAVYDGSWSAVSTEDMTYWYVKGCITKTECHSLLVNANDTATGLLNFDQYYDPDNEWDGVTFDSYHEVVLSDECQAKLQEDPNGTPADITNSTITSTTLNQLLRGGSAMTMPSSAEEIDTYLNDVYSGGVGCCLSRIVHIVTLASTGYTLTAAAGTHSVTGTAAGLLQSIIFSLAAGTHSVTGTAADLLISYLLSAAEGVHAVTGTAANFLRSYAVLANAGTHSVSGTAAGTLYSRIFLVDPGTHSVVGTAAGLSKIFVVLAESGTYVVTGTAADLLQSIILEAGVGVHSVTGTAAGVLYSRVFGVDPGTHSLTGTVVDFLRSYLVDASPGSHSLSGSEVDFLRSYLVDAGVGSHSVTGSDVNFLRSLIMSLAAGVHSVTGTDAILEKLVGYVLNADPGTYLVTGPAAQLLYSRIMSVDSGTHSVTGTAADIFRLFTLQANAGIVSVTGTNADLLRSMLLDAQAGTHSLTGTEADLLRSLLLNAEAGTVNLVGTDADLLMSRLLSAVPGVVSVSGTDADLLRSLLLSAGVGSYSVVGTDADLLLIQGYVLQAESGTYVVTGIAADLIYSGTGVKPDYIILHRRRRRT